MSSFVDRTQVFIVRVWYEPQEFAGAAPECRGVIEHLPGGERVAVKDLGEITTFIDGYLANGHLPTWRARLECRQPKP